MDYKTVSGRKGEKMVRSVIGAIVLASLVMTGCGKKEETQAKRPYEGQSIMLIVPKLHANMIRGPIQDEAKKFEAETGARIRIVTPGWNETIEKINQSLSDPKLNYDIFVVIALWNGTLLAGDHVAPVPGWVKKKIDWDDVLPIYRDNILTWNHTAYALPYDGDCINLYYRKDIFADPEYKKRFRVKYGYALRPPETWREYRDIAEFFTGWDWDRDGQIEYGAAGLRLSGDVTLLQFFARAAAYAKHPDDRAYYFDPDTMKARINNPGFVRALEEWVDVIRFGPPGMASFAGHDVRDTFVTGQVAMAMDWADLGIYAVNSPSSIVQDKIGYAQIPGSDTVYNAKTAQWEKRHNQVSSISGNWMFFVNKASKHKELAFEFAAHMTSPEITKVLSARSGNSVNPSRYSHFSDPASWNEGGFTTESAKAYLDEITRSLSNPNVVIDITIPGAGEYYQALDRYIHAVTIGKMDAKTALDKAAAEWEMITDRLGRDKQREFYRKSLNLAE